MPAAQARDLIALKLFAGGAQDAWDIAQLLAGPDREAIVADVSADVVAVPSHCHALWAHIVAGDA